MASACELALDLANPATAAALVGVVSEGLAPLTAEDGARAVVVAEVALGANIAAHDLGAAFTGAGVGSGLTSGAGSVLTLSSDDAGSLVCSPPSFSVLAAFVCLGLPFGRIGTIGTAGMAALVFDLAVCVGVTLATVDVCVVFTEAGVVGEVDCALSDGRSWVDGVSGRSVGTSEAVALSTGADCSAGAETVGPACSLAGN